MTRNNRSTVRTPSPTFLSVDMDFFGMIGDLTTNYDQAEHCLKNLVEFAKSKSIPITAVMNHQQMLKAVNNSSARRLINYDAHSDLADGLIDEFSCGTWISYVTWRTEGEYRWMRSDKDISTGLCGYCFRPGYIDIFGDSSVFTDWKKVRTYYAQNGPSRRWLREENIVGISVCMSPGWTSANLIDLFYSWKEANNIPYTNGRWNEYHGVRRIPPGNASLHKFVSCK